MGATCRIDEALFVCALRVSFGVGVEATCPDIQDFYVEHFVTRGAAEITPATMRVGS
jgi:hypothetical protein